MLLGSLGHAPNQAAEAAAAAAAAAAGVVQAAPPVLRGAAAEASFNVYVQLMLAAIHPEGHVPDTPERKVSQQLADASLVVLAVDTVCSQSLSSGARMCAWRVFCLLPC